MSLLARITHLSRRCPPAWKVTRAVSEPGREPEIAAHLESCIRCASHYQAHRDVVTRLRAASGPSGLSSESRAAISARLWNAKPHTALQPRRRWMLGIAAIAAVTAIVLGFTALRRPQRREQPLPGSARTSAASLATIHSFGTARYERTQAAPDEIVRLHDGRILLDITPLHPSERFRVLTDDAVVEVRGTVFELTALAGRLVAASVARGRVEVKAGNAFAVLDAGDRWERAAAPVAAAPAVAPPPTRMPARRPSRPVKPRPSTEVERAMFARGWSSLRAGKAAEAAVAFAELEARAAGSSLEEDALYWRAVAEARRRGRQRQATPVFPTDRRRRERRRRFRPSPRPGPA